jgi:hypothetical protein
MNKDRGLWQNFIWAHFLQGEVLYMDFLSTKEFIYGFFQQYASAAL